jgi:hypothetical protein
MEKMYTDDRRKVLPLTDDNLQAINIRLWQAIKQTNMQTLYDSLDTSIREQVSYDAMKRYIDQGLKNRKLNLRMFRASRESEEKLKIRITGHQFFLNNMLILLGMTFEDLFDVSKNTQEHIPEKVEEEEVKPDYELDYKAYLKNIDKKLDEIILLSSRSKKKSYTERYLEVDEYLSSINSFFISAYVKPDENGFRNFKQFPMLTINPDRFLQGDMNKFKEMLNFNQKIQFYFSIYRSQPFMSYPSEIYLYESLFLKYFLQMIHKRSNIHSFFDILEKHKNQDILFGRLLAPFFILLIFFHLLIKFIERGNDNKKAIFLLVSKDRTNSKVDNDELLGYCKNNDKRLVGIIEHILSSETEIRPEYELCVSFEKLMAGFFMKVKDIFIKHSFNQGAIFKMLIGLDERKTFEKKVSELIIPGDTFSCEMTPVQLEAIKGLESEIEDAQINLENYYVGNEHRRTK